MTIEWFDGDPAVRRLWEEDRELYSGSPTATETDEPGCLCVPGTP